MYNIHVQSKIHMYMYAHMYSHIHDNLQKLMYAQSYDTFMYICNISLPLQIPL